MEEVAGGRGWTNGMEMEKNQGEVDASVVMWWFTYGELCLPVK